MKIENRYIEIPSPPPLHPQKMWNVIKIPKNIHLEPDWGLEDQFITRNLHYVFEADALETSRPMNNPIYVMDDIYNMFDSISYEKGTALNPSNILEKIE